VSLSTRNSWEACGKNDQIKTGVYEEYMEEAYLTISSEIDGR